jgi:hypothetical protein
MIYLLLMAVSSYSLRWKSKFRFTTESGYRICQFLNIVYIRPRVCENYFASTIFGTALREWANQPFD